MNALEMLNVSKRFGRETVLSDITFALPEGQTLVLFGPSGAGKTVLLRLIAGVIEPDEGTIRILNEDMFDTEPEHRGLGMAFQNFALFPHMSAFENIASPLKAKRLERQRIHDSVHTVARLLKIDHVLGHAPRALSNGQKQRTALARALVASPKLLLLDDPLRNVDAKLRFEMRLELPRLLATEGASVVYVTQDYKEAMALGDQIAVLDQGRIVQYGTPEEVYLQPGSMAIARLFGDPTINLLDVEPLVDQGQVCVSISGVAIPIDEGYRYLTGRDCVLGIRPESLNFVDTAVGDTIPVQVEAETPLNEKIVTLVITSGSRELLVSRPVDTAGPASGDAWVSIDEQSLILFDRHSGKRLVPDDGASHGC